MYWYKVKNVLIILFALINIFLIGAIASENIYKKRDEQRLRESLISVLENSNVKIDSELIQRDAPQLSTKQVENCIVADAEFAARVLGGAPEAKYDEGGVLYYALGENKLYLANGRLHYYNASFSGDGDVSATAIRSAKAALGKIGAPMEDYREKTQGDTIIFTLYTDGAPLFGNCIYVKMAGGEIGELWGYIIKNTAYSGSPASLRSSADVLLEFLQGSAHTSQGVTVTALELGYSILTQGSDVDFKTADAIPTYKLETSDGQVFYYDARKR